MLDKAPLCWSCTSTESDVSVSDACIEATWVASWPDFLGREQVVDQDAYVAFVD